MDVYPLPPPPPPPPSTINSLSLSLKNIHILDLTMLSFLFIGLLYIFISPLSSIHMPFFHPPKSHCHPTATLTMGDDLQGVLEETCTENKTLIIAAINKAYVEGDKSMLDLFLDSLWLGENTQALTDHLLIVAVDQTAYKRCRFLRLHCHKLETDGVDFRGEKLYMSNDFIKMMWRRTLFLGDVLKRGYNFIFTDIDVMWLRNPFSRLILNETLDLQISTDSFNGDESNKLNPINTGFYMVRSNNRTVTLFDTWYARKDNSNGMKEQDVLQNLMHESAFRELGIRMRFLDTLYFSGFCQDSKDVMAVVTVHANCCRTLSAKLVDLTAVIHHWNRFKRVSNNGSLAFGNWSAHAACTKSWRN